MENILKRTIICTVLLAALMLGLCVPLSSQSTVITVSGDLNGDDATDISDVVLLLQHILFPDLYPVEYPGGVDFSDDGNEDINDVVLLLQHSLFPDLYSIKELDTEPYVYKHVVIIGVDGAGSFFRDADTPNLDRIFADGSVNYEWSCMVPSSSNPCWGSLLHGVLPSVHGRTNDSTGSFPPSPYPSIFKVVRNSDPDCALASFNNWNTINRTLLESGSAIIMMDNGSDAVLTGMITEYLSNNSPKLMFVQFDGADAAGHENGYGSAKHLERISEIDSYIGRIYDKMVETGMIEDTLIIVTADHGGTPGGDHGGTSKKEMEIMTAVAGKTVIKGRMNSGDLRDIAAIALYALGLEQPEAYTAVVPGNLFPGVGSMPRPGQ